MTDTPKEESVPQGLSMSVRLAWFLTTSVIGLIFDLGSKAWMERTLLGSPGRTMMIFDPWLEFSLTYNHGTAFSIISDLGDTRWLFGIFALAMAVAILVWVIREPHLTRLQLVCFGLIIVGAVGNGVERIQGNGVVDFVKINYPWGGSYPAWNVADACIVVSVLILFVLSYRTPKTDSGPKASESATPASS